jgi:tetrahydromethanopterin S-methyltransferase subunit B
MNINTTVEKIGKSSIDSCIFLFLTRYFEEILQKVKKLTQELNDFEKKWDHMKAYPKSFPTTANVSIALTIFIIFLFSDFGDRSNLCP